MSNPATTPTIPTPAAPIPAPAAPTAPVTKTKAELAAEKKAAKKAAAAVKKAASEDDGAMRSILSGKRNEQSVKSPFVFPDDKKEYVTGHKVLLTDEQAKDYRQRGLIY